MKWLSRAQRDSSQLLAGGYYLKGVYLEVGFRGSFKAKLGSDQIKQIVFQTCHRRKRKASKQQIQVIDDQMLQVPSSNGEDR